MLARWPALTVRSTRAARGIGLMVAEVLVVSAALAGALVHPSPRTAALEGVLEDFDTFHDPQLEAGCRCLRLVLAQIKAMKDDFGGVRHAEVSAHAPGPGTALAPAVVRATG